MGLIRTSQQLRRHPWHGEVAAGAILIAALSARATVGAAFNAVPFITVFPAIVLATLFGGSRSGVAVATLGISTRLPCGRVGGMSIARRSAGEAIVQSRASNQTSVFRQSVRGLVRLLADASRHAADKGDHERAIQLLKQNLSPVQLEQYKRSGHFDVIGGDTGRRYRIRRGYQMNVELLDKNGRRVCCLCFMPAGPPCRR
jgi:hypothetical protein